MNFWELTFVDFIIMNIRLIYLKSQRKHHPPYKIVCLSLTEDDFRNKTRENQRPKIPQYFAKSSFYNHNQKNNDEITFFPTWRDFPFYNQKSLQSHRLNKMESPQPRKRSLSHNDLNKDFIFLQKRVKNRHLSGDDTQCFQQVVEKESEFKIKL